MLMGTEYVDFSDEPSYITGSVPKKAKAAAPSAVAAYTAALDGPSESGFLGMSSSSLWTIGVLGLVGLGFYFYEGR